MRRIQYEQVVTFKDIDAEENYADEGMQNFTEFYYRLSYQKAHPDLVQEMAEAAQAYQALKERLGRIKVCFPKE